MVTLSDIVVIAFDLALALGATLRLTRFIVADDVPGNWFIKAPLDAVIAKKQRTGEEWETYERLVKDRDQLLAAGAQPHELAFPVPPEPADPPAWARYREGLSCPYCVSVWMAAAVLISLVLVGGAGDAALWWRYIAGFLALAYVTGHLAARLGDTEE